MDKNAIKKYAVWARRELIERVTQRALFYGVTATEKADLAAASVNGRLLSDTEKAQRQASSPRWTITALTRPSRKSPIPGSIALPPCASWRSITTCPHIHGIYQ